MIFINKGSIKPNRGHALYIDNPSMVDTGKANKDGNQVIKPAMIKAYNQHMGGVDRVDLQLHAVQALRKAYKRYKKLAFRLILQAALNAHKIFIEITPKAQDKKISFIDFLFRCIKQIVTAPKDQIAPRNDELSRLTGRHFNVLIPCKEGAKNAKKRCRVCYAQKIKTVSGGDCRTVYHCEDCPSLPGLHTGKCFKIYHTLKDYSTLE